MSDTSRWDFGLEVLKSKWDRTPKVLESERKHFGEGVGREEISDPSDQSAAICLCVCVLLFCYLV